jgi:tetratricopeptide (TPR) repeat protein
MGNDDDAITVYERVLRVERGNFVALGSLAVIYEQRGEAAEADSYYRAALDAARSGEQFARIVPRYVRFLLATHERTNPAEAVAIAERMVEQSGRRDPAWFDLLATACAGAGRIDDAISAAESALSVANRRQLAALIPTLERKLQAYRDAKP